MRALILTALLAAACGGGAELGPDSVDYGQGELGDLAHLAGDGAIASVDYSTSPVDAAGPPADIASPADMTPACGAAGQPCCGGEICTQLGQPSGSFCGQGTCADSRTSCWMTGSAPTCYACGALGQRCCGSTCYGGTHCAGPASAFEGYCT